MWAFLVAAVIFGVLVAWFILSLRYNSNILQTVIESPAYSIKKIPFPAVTLCNSNRLNMHRIEEVADKFIPNATAALRLKFKKVLSQLNILRFGWFHYMTFLKNYRLEELNKLNLSQVFIFTMYKCSELFVSCYWNGRETDCCKIFFVQSTDYGYCYGFNSLISLDAYEFNTHQKISSKHPLYTDYYGVGSGLRVIVNIKRSCNALVTKISGVNVITHRNYEWPTTGYFVPVGNSVTISLRPNLYRTTDALQHYSNTDRQCLFEKSNDMKKYFIPKEVPFLQANCKVECRRYYMNKFCNCTIDIFYPTSPFRACNITGVLCLNDYNDVLFKDILAVDESTYSLIDKGVYGMKCSCLPECIRIEYGATVQNNLIWETENSSVVNVNVFYTSPTMVKYRTEASLHRLQFITNFGGILAFFFGASLLSVIEMIHRLFVMFLRFIFHRIKTHAFSKQKPDDLTV